MDQDRPIIRIRAGVEGERLTSKPSFVPRPPLTAAQQARRLTPTVERRLSDVIANRVDVTTDPKGLAAERAVVLEIAGQIGNFKAAAERVGLEWLAEEIARIELDAQMAAALGKQGIDEEEDDFDYFEDDILETFLNDEVEKPTVSGRLYFGMPTLDSFKKILRLWKKFKAGDAAPDKHGDWWQLFGYMKDVRAWGPEDRISPSSRQTLNDILLENPKAPVKAEIDLWFRGQEDDRDRAFKQFATKLAEIGGTLLDDTEIEEIRYHAALVSLPASQVRRLTMLTSSLAFADEIMSITPQSQMSGRPSEAAVMKAPRTPQILAKPDRRPEIVALLDGYPIEHHDWLNNRISITEVDVPASRVPVAQRSHGTAMASLILHGDIAENAPPLNRTLKVVPILVPGQGMDETNPSDQLPIALIYRAVNRLKNDKQKDSAAPEVLIINHSLGVEGLQFAQTISPWARMLDYLAFKKKILFIVSAGNIKGTFEVPGYTDPRSFSGADPAKRQRDIFLGLEASKARRTMLTPAEQVNGLTVGATHFDASSNKLKGGAVDPYDCRLPNLVSGLGLGFRRSVKPDIAAPGGRLVAQPSATDPFSVHGHHAEQLGQLAASPDHHGPSLDVTRRTVGTSNAAALTTRAAVQVADALDVAFQGEPDHWRDLPTSAVMLKALVAHSARWGDAGAYIEQLLHPQGWRPCRENVARHLGYGEIDPDLVMSGSTHRVTLLGEGTIRKGKRHPFFVPLPRELSAKKDVRSIIVTLAWMSPIMPGSQNYRKVGLELVPSVRGQNFWNGVQREKSTQPPADLGREGTLIHTIYSGDNALPISVTDGITFNVQAWSRLSGVTRIDIPYALAVTVEVADTLNADIYQSVRTRLRPRARV